MTTSKIVLSVVLIIVLWIIVTTILNILRHHHALPRIADIVIVGSGPGGCVMARRLHDKYPHLSIVLLERGKDYRNDRNVYRSEAALSVAYSEPYSEVIPCDFPGVTCSAAKMVGGGSQHNFGLVVKGSTQFMSKEWIPTFDSSEAEFKALRDKIEARMDITPLPVSINLLARALPSLGALLSKGMEEIKQGIDVVSHVGPLRANEELSKWLSSSMSHANDPQARLVEDYNASHHQDNPNGTGGINIVCHTPRLFVDKVLGIRAGVARAYLPLNDGSNYKKVEEAEVHSISIATDQRHGYNETPTHPDSYFINLKDGRHIQVRRKIILCAGSLHTPLILMRSGLGGNQVGQNLMNHYGTTMVMAIKSRNPDFSSGPLAFLSDRQDVLTGRKWEIVTSGSTLTNLTFLEAQGIDVAKYQAEGYNFITFLGWLLKPEARGSVELHPGWYHRDHTGKKTLEQDVPVINLNMFKTVGDQQDIIELMRYFGDVYNRLSRQIGNPAFEKVKLLFPQQDVFLRNDPAELLATAKVGISVTDHYAGTCAYGKVLNSDFSLKDQKDIHVVDASAVPMIADGNMEYPTLLLAELAATRIKL
jgi:choline dehydrogenase-like flavoprotein